MFRRISHYDVASTPESAYIIGGLIYHSAISIEASKIIAKFANNEWTKHGELSKARFFHKTLTFESRTMIFGGIFYGRLATEVWKFEQSYTHFIQPELIADMFSKGFGMYLVDVNFCKNVASYE